MNLFVSSTSWSEPPSCLQVPDRPGHDRRYAINCDKLKNELGWKRRVDFEEGLERTRPPAATS